MAKQGTKYRQERSALLSKIPDGASRVQVKTAEGKLSYKDADKLADTDEIQTKKNGEPIVMWSSPGRKRNVVIEPENPTIREILKRKDDFIDKDPLRRITQEDPESPDVLQQVMVGISEEVASLGFERTEADRRGKDTSVLSQRRVIAMRALADTWLKRKEQVATRGIDLDSPAFELVFGYIMETFKNALQGAKARPEMIETVFAKFAQLVNEEWKAEAQIRMKKLV